MIECKYLVISIIISSSGLTRAKLDIFINFFSSGSLLNLYLRQVYWLCQHTFDSYLGEDSSWTKRKHLNRSINMGSRLEDNQRRESKYLNQRKCSCDIATYLTEQIDLSPWDNVVTWQWPDSNTVYKTQTLDIQEQIKFGRICCNDNCCVNTYYSSISLFSW